MSQEDQNLIIKLLNTMSLASFINLEKYKSFMEFLNSHPSPDEIDINFVLHNGKSIYHNLLENEEKIIKFRTDYDGFYYKALDTLTSRPEFIER